MLKVLKVSTDFETLKIEKIKFATNTKSPINITSERFSFI